MYTQINKRALILSYRFYNVIGILVKLRYNNLYFWGTKCFKFKHSNDVRKILYMGANT